MMTILSIVLFVVGALMILGSITNLTSKSNVNGQSKRSAIGMLFFGITALCIGWVSWPSGSGEPNKPIAKSKDTVKKHSVVDDLTLSQKLALIDKRKILDIDDDYVLETTNLLELLSNKYKEPQDSIDEGRRLQLFMEREGISRQQLADEYKIDKSQITRYINGILNCPLELLKYLHIKYKLNYSWFFHGTGTMKVKELEKRKITTDITDILASQSMILAAMESMREDLNRLAKDFYATKHNV